MESPLGLQIFKFLNVTKAASSGPLLACLLAKEWNMTISASAMIAMGRIQRSRWQQLGFGSKKFLYLSILYILHILVRICVYRMNPYDILIAACMEGGSDSKFSVLWANASKSTCFPLPLGSLGSAFMIIKRF